MIDIVVCSILVEDMYKNIFPRGIGVAPQYHKVPR